MKAIWAVVIMTIMTLVGFLAGAFITNTEAGCFCVAIIFALISGIGCIIQAINNKPHNTEE